jgi:aryl-alcohol dehydrogenase-like predicted oxidoreductase
MTQRPEPYERYDTDRVFDALERLEVEAAALGTSMAGLALAWLLSVDEVTAVVIGPGRAEHLAPAIEALSVSLTARQRDALTEVFQ